jgi:hypothetical protein
MMLIAVLMSALPPVTAQQKSGGGVNVRGILYPEEVAEKEKRVKLGRPKRVTAPAPKLPPRAPEAPPPVGLGYTLFVRQPDGTIVRADPSRPFQTGTDIRLVFEPNIDGYLYIVHREGDGPPKLLFPDKRLTQKNRVSAHKSITIPSDDWWRFKESDSLKKLGQVVERLTVILSRDELDVNADVILGGISSLWKFKNKLNVLTDAQDDAGTEISRVENRAITRRDIDLADAPQATVVVANFGLDPLVVANIDLAHRARK